MNLYRVKDLVMVR